MNDQTTVSLTRISELADRLPAMPEIVALYRIERDGATIRNKVTDSIILFWVARHDACEMLFYGSVSKTAVKTVDEMLSLTKTALRI